MTTPTNKSSRLLADSDVLNSLINESNISATVEVIPEVTSTQKVLLERDLETLRPGLTLITHHQTAGIGRLDRTWESQPGDGVMMSYVFRTSDPLLPLFVGAALVGALKKYLPQISLKWPNDLVIELDTKTRKLGGIVLQRHPKDPELVVAGIGINLKFSDSRPTEEAISLHEVSDAKLDINELIFEIIKELSSPIVDVVSTYKRSCTTIGKKVRVQMLNSSDVIGHATDISASGGLIVETENGQVELLTGDVKHLRANE